MFDTARIEDVFAARGPVAVSKKGYRKSEQQVLLAQAIAEVYKIGSADARKGAGRAVLGIAEAATGTGKSLAGLIALGMAVAVSGDRGMVSTYSLHLQSQYFGGQLPGPGVPVGGDMAIALAAVEWATGKRLRVAIRRGMRNFISLGRVEHMIETLQVYLEGLRANDKERVEAEKRLAILGKMRIYAIDALNSTGPTDGLIDDFWTQAGAEFKDMRDAIADAKVGLDSACENSDRPAFDRHLAVAKTADIVVVPHILAVIQAKMRVLDRDILNGDGRAIRYALFDEADKLGDAADAYATSTISLRRISRAASRSLVLKDDKRVAALQKAVDNFDLMALRAYEAINGEKPPSSKRRAEWAKNVEALGDFVPSGKGGCLFITPGRSIDEDMISAAENVRAASRAVLGDRSISSDLRADVRDMLAGITMFVEACEDMRRSGVVVNEVGERELSDRARYLSAPIINWSPEKAYVTAGVRALMPGRILGRLWNGFTEDGERESELHAAFFMSASLSSNLSDDDWARAFKQTIGIFSDDPAKRDVTALFQRAFLLEESRFEPKKFGEMRIRLANPDFFPWPTTDQAKLIEVDGVEKESHINPDWVDVAARAIEETVCDKNGLATLVLVPTKFEVVRFGELLRPRLEKSGIVVLTKGKPGDLAEAFKSARSAGKQVLWISASVWEGLDLPGVIDDLVIARIPRPPVDNVTAMLAARVAGAQAALHTKEGKNKFAALGRYYTGFLHKVIAAKTVGKLRQGIGRGIRKFDDTVRLTILDPRFPVPEGLRLIARIKNNASLLGWARGLVGALPQRFRRVWETDPSAICSVYAPRGAKRIKEERP